MQLITGKRFIIFMSIFLATGLSFLLNGQRFKVIEEQIELGAGAELRIIQISDLHLTRERRIYRTLAEKINELNPDLLLITGDSIEESESLELLDNFLAGLNPAIAKYAILGNWEYWGKVDLERLRELYSRHNCRLLVNEGEQLELKGRKLNLFGIDDLLGGRPSLDGFNYLEDGINLILVHCPAYFDIINSKYPDRELFVFSGHTHGGEVTFFGSPIFLPAGSGDYLKGIYRKAQSTLYLSKGIGNSVSEFRVFARPDLFYITVK